MTVVIRAAGAAMGQWRCPRSTTKQASMRTSSSSRAAALALILACLSAGATSAAEFPTDRLIVRFKPGHATLAKSSAGREALAARLTERSGEMMRPLRVMGDGSQVMQLFRRLSGAQAKALSHRFAGDAEIAEILPDRIAFPALVPNDPQLADQWALT